MQNPLEAVPEKFRLALYSLYAVAGPVLIYLGSQDITGEAEYALYVGIGTVFGITAASNTRTGPRHAK